MSSVSSEEILPGAFREGGFRVRRWRRGGFGRFFADKTGALFAKGKENGWRQCRKIC